MSGPYRPQNRNPNSSPHSGGGGGGSYRPPNQAQPLPAFQPAEYFADKKAGRLRPELLCEDAETTAKKLNEEKLPNAQLRKFFGEVRHLEKMVSTQGFDVVRPLVRMLAAKAHYSLGREKIKPSFCAFLSGHAKKIQDADDFAAFVKHFEAIVGFHYYLNPKG
jgi:CRISPR-associated protein Csm2